MSNLKKTFSKLGNLNEEQVNKAVELSAKFIYKGKLSPRVRQRLQTVLRWAQRILTIAAGFWILLPDPIIGSVDDGGIAAGLITWLLINANRLEKAKKLVTILADAADGAPVGTSSEAKPDEASASLSHQSPAFTAITTSTPSTFTVRVPTEAMRSPKVEAWSSEDPPHPID